MALILRSADLAALSRQRRHWAYNALDCIMTRRAADGLLPQLAADPLAQRHYAFQHAQHAVAIAMAIRGIAIDETALRKTILAQEATEREAIAAAQKAAAPWWDERTHLAVPCPASQTGRHKWPRGEPPESKKCSACDAPWFFRTKINPHSSAQLIKLLYRNMGLPEQREHVEHRVSAARECLDRLGEREDCVHALPLLEAILEAHTARKQLGTLRTRRDTDGRWRSSFHVGMDVTGRWSSSSGPWWTGANIQNIADRSRGIFVPDPGLVLFYADYSSAESRAYAYCAGDEKYIEAHESGDVHTAVARMLWPDACAWTGDDGADRELANAPSSFDPAHSWRDLAKRCVHGADNGLTPYGLARQARIPRALAKKVHGEFFTKFRRLQQFQNEIWGDIEEKGIMVSPLGRKRLFMGRLHGEGADATRREALAHLPQSMVVDWLGIAICRLWTELDGAIAPWRAPSPSDPNRVWLLAQVHDAVLGEIRWGDDAALAEVLRLMDLTLSVRGRPLRIPVEIKIGPSWRKTAMCEWRPGFEWPKEWR